MITALKEEHPTDAGLNEAARLAGMWLAQHCGAPELAVPAARLWQAADDGHTAMPISELGLNIKTWKKASPFIVIEDGWVAIARLDAAERRLAAHLCTKLAQTTGTVEAQVEKLFPVAAGKPKPTEQISAVTTALGRAMTVITGGPGTGKTYAVQRLLAALLAKNPDLAAAITAPTGKAARRAKEAILTNLDHLPVAPAIRTAISEIAAKASTIHRLLGWNPGTGRLRHHDAEPLGVDVVVLDEASMVDLIMFDALVAALPSHALLVVLGDPCQLASVEEGVVLGDLTSTLSGHPAIRRLTVSRRFTADSGIGKVAHHLRQVMESTKPDTGVAAAATAAAWQALTCHDPAAHAVPDLAAGLDEVLNVWSALATAKDGPGALDILRRAVVLTPTREGPRGVGGLNQRLGAALGITGSDQPGRPILITVNDPATGLDNGDLGIIWPDRDGNLFAWFDADRSIPLANLPEHQTAWALTIHKSQGSEWPLVVTVLPEEDHPLLTTELIYTAISRAKTGLVVVAAEPVFTAGCRRRTHRRSRLGARVLGMAKQVSSMKSKKNPKESP